jgi:hypothetical protein
MNELAAALHLTDNTVRAHLLSRNEMDLLVNRGREPDLENHT